MPLQKAQSMLGSIRFCVTMQEDAAPMSVDCPWVGEISPGREEEQMSPGSDASRNHATAKLKSTFGSPWGWHVHKSEVEICIRDCRFLKHAGNVMNSSDTRVIF